jgi:hypothetical protein
MEINLKDLVKTKEAVKYIQSILRDQPVTKGLSRKLDDVVRLYDEIESDLELGSESIIELDKPRLEAIEERNKMLNFLNKTDDI